MSVSGFTRWRHVHFYRMHSRRHKYHLIVGHTKRRELVTLCGRRLPGLTCSCWWVTPRPPERDYCKDCARKE